jgi:hypothetical protein
MLCGVQFITLATDSAVRNTQIKQRSGLFIIKLVANIGISLTLYVLAVSNANMVMRTSDVGATVPT